jgi:large subunit ribosomal protein L29
MASKAAELRDLPADELHARIDAAKEELFNLRFQLATGQLDNPARMRVVRHEVARIATVLREREIEEGLDDIPAPETVTGREIGSADGPQDGEDRQ